MKTPVQIIYYVALLALALSVFKALGLQSLQLQHLKESFYNEHHASSPFGEIDRLSTKSVSINSSEQISGSEAVFGDSKLVKSNPNPFSQEEAIRSLASMAHKEAGHAQNAKERIMLLLRKRDIVPKADFLVPAPGSLPRFTYYCGFFVQICAGIEEYFSAKSIQAGADGAFTTTLNYNPQRMAVTNRRSQACPARTVLACQQYYACDSVCLRDIGIKVSKTCTDLRTWQPLVMTAFHVR